jgi:hypothetical protein
MVTRGVFYGIVIIFVVLLLASSTLAIVYFNDYEQATAQNSSYVGELNTALVSYRSLSGSYDSSLRDYNTTLSLLAEAVANLNTSTHAYQQASIALGNLWSSYQQLAGADGRKTLVYEVEVLVDFGNGTAKWYNDTSIEPGWNGYVATLVVLRGEVNATWYPQYGEHFVTVVDEVPQTGTTSWFVWKYGGGGWTVSETGADQLPIDNGTTLAWTLCPYDSGFNPTCSP